MRKRIKTLVALGLAVVMMAGCGNTASTNKETPGKSTESAAASESAKESTEKVEESKYPEYLNLDGYRPIVKEDEEITLTVGVVRSTLAESNVEDTWFYNFIEEKLNINLEVTEYTDESIKEKKNLMMVSGEMPDIMINLGFNANQISEYGVGEGMLLPLSDYINEDLTPSIVKAFEGQEFAVASCTATDGKMYVLPTFKSNTPGYGDTLADVRVYIDTKYMDAAGIKEVPTTLDEFTDMLRAFKALDPATMGVKEIIPMIAKAKYERHYLLQAFGFITDSGNNVTKACWDTVEDRMTVPSLDEKFEDYVTYLHMLYEEGLIHQDLFTIDDTAVDAIMAERAAGVIGISAPYLIQPEAYDEYVSVSILTSDVEPDPYINGATGYAMGKILVSADTEYPELCMRFLDYLYSDEGVSYLIYGPAAGSEDTLGIVEGYTIDAAGDYVYEDSTYESNYEYRLNKIQLWEGQIDEGRANKNGYEIATGKEYVVPELDPESGADANYRYKILKAFEGYEEYFVPMRPDAFCTSDQSAQFTDLQTTLRAYVDAEFAKFVVGERSLDTFDQYYKDLDAMGRQEFLDLINEMYAGYSVDTK